MKEGEVSPAVDYRQIFLDANDAVLLADLDSGLILDVNSCLCDLLHRPREALVGIHHDEIFVSDIGGEAGFDQMPGVSSLARQFSINKNLLLRADGKKIPVEISTSLMNLDGRVLASSIIRDITERELAKAGLAASNALLNAIGTLQSRFIGSVPMNTLLKEILESFLALTGSEYGFLGESFQTSDGMPYFKIQVMSDSVWSAVTRDFYARNAPIGLEFYNLDGIFGTILKSTTPLVFNDFSVCAVRHVLPEGHPPVSTFVGLPLINGEETLGFIGLANRPQGYDTELLDFLKPLLAVCGSLIATNRASQWRQGAESELRRQALVFNNISDAVILTDHDGIVLDCNPAALAMLGTSKKRLLGVPFDFALSPEDDTAHQVRTAIDAVDQEGSWSGMLSVERRDGEQGTWDTNVLPLRDDVDGSSALVWFNHDITERRVAQAKLAKRTLELNAIADLSPDGFVFVDRYSRVTYVNSAFEREIGLRANLILGISRAAFDEAMSELCEVVPSTMQRSDEECVLLQLRRPKLTLLKRTQRVLHDERGALEGTVQYYRDVTQEAEVDRMKSDFLSTAAHELRTPMASVFGFSELLLRRNFAPEKQREFLEIIHRQAGQLVCLVNELLDLARIEARTGKDFKLGEYDLAPIIHHSIAELYRPDERQSFDVDIPEQLPRVLVDPDKLQLAISNVIGNAVKYSMGSGVIDVAIRQREAEGARQVGVIVRDRGIGMTPEQIERIFERFYRADTSGKIPGTGLGMSIVKEIIGIFKGTVDVRSSLGGGCEITLWLPVAPVPNIPVQWMDDKDGH
ncbi:MAG: PAS domain S-box protein [Rhodocyclaceae bacterium]